MESEVEAVVRSSFWTRHLLPEGSCRRSWGFRLLLFWPQDTTSEQFPFSNKPSGWSWLFFSAASLFPKAGWGKPVPGNSRMLLAGS